MRKFFAVAASPSRWMRNAVLALVLPALLLDLGCSKASQAPASPAASDSLDSKSASAALTHELNRWQMIQGIHFGRIGTGCDISKGVFPVDPSTDMILKQAQKLGWVKITPDGPGFWKSELENIPADVVAPEAIEKAREKNMHLAAKGCDYQLLFLPFATKTLVDVSEIKKIDDNNFDVAYRWKWVITPAGAKLTDGFSPEQVQSLNQMLQEEPFPKDPKIDLSQLSNAQPQSARMKATRVKDGWWARD